MKKISPKIQEKLKREAKFSPLVVPVSEDETEDQFEERWRKFDDLSESDKEALSSKKNTEVIKKIQKFLKLTDNQCAFISRAIRKFFFNELRAGEIAEYLVENGISANDAKKIQKILSEKVIKEDRIEEVKVIKISISEAIKKIPEIKNQIISSKPIKIKKYERGVRPTIGNWIQDYQERLGVGNHGLIERGDYLFHSENGKELNYTDRQKVGLILKSLDEGLKLKILEKEKKVSFKGDKKSEKNKRKKASKKLPRKEFTYPNKVNNNNENENVNFLEKSKEKQEREEEKEVEKKKMEFNQKETEKINRESKKEQKNVYQKKEKEERSSIEGKEVQKENKENKEIREKEGNIKERDNFNKGLSEIGKRENVQKKSNFNFDDEWLSNPYIIRPSRRNKKRKKEDK